MQPEARALINGLEVEKIFHDNLKVVLIPDRVSERGLRITSIVTYTNNFLNLTLEGLSQNVVLTGNDNNDSERLAEMLDAFICFCLQKYESMLKSSLKDFG